MEKDDFASSYNSSQGATSVESVFPSLSPTIYADPNATLVDIAEVEEKHESDAITVLLMNVTIIGCLLLAYYVKQYRIYYLPERYVCPAKTIYTIFSLCPAANRLLTLLYDLVMMHLLNCQQCWSHYTWHVHWWHSEIDNRQFGLF